MLSNKTYTTAATETVKASKAKALSKCGLWPKTTRKSEIPASGSPLHPNSGGARAGGSYSAMGSHMAQKSWGHLHGKWKMIKTTEWTSLRKAHQRAKQPWEDILIIETWHKMGELWAGRESVVKFVGKIFCILSKST